MMRSGNYLLQIFFLLYLTISSSFFPVSVGNGHARPTGSQKHAKHGERSKHGSDTPDAGHSNNSASSQAPHFGSYGAHSRIFDLMSFGATGDGVSDDSKALLAAWKAACLVPGATIEIPSGFLFLVKPVTLQGPCMPHLVLQVDGTLLAPSRPQAWPKSSLFQWVNLKWLQNFTLQGSGTLDGQGSEWWKWSLSLTPQLQKEGKYQSSDIRPTAVRFYKSFNVTVRDIRIINSPLCHLKFDNSGGVKVKNITVSSPQNSPNTDGIHLQNTRDVEIKHSTIGCGDDCISIQTGCSNVHIHHVNCNPSHGISLGGLGKGNSLACVSNVSVDNMHVKNALSGVRIKTWQGGIGTVRNITFSNILVSNVEIPILIDQYYCYKKSCKNKTDAVAISQIIYKGISGTYSLQPMHLACSDSFPCTGVNITDIWLRPAGESQGPQPAFCWKSYGESQGSLEPSITGCLQRSNRLIRGLTKSHSYGC